MRLYDIFHVCDKSEPMNAEIHSESIKGILIYENSISGVTYYLTYNGYGRCWMDEYHRNSYIFNIFAGFLIQIDDEFFVNPNLSKYLIKFPHDISYNIITSDSWGNSSWHFGHFLADNLPCILHHATHYPHQRILDFISSSSRFAFEKRINILRQFALLDFVTVIKLCQFSPHHSVSSDNWFHFELEGDISRITTPARFYRQQFFTNLGFRSDMDRTDDDKGQNPTLKKNQKYSHAREIKLIFLSRNSEAEKRLLNETELVSMLTKKSDLLKAHLGVKSLSVESVDPSGVPQMYFLTDDFDEKIFISAASSAMYNPLMFGSHYLVWFNDKKAKDKNTSWLIGDHIREFGFKDVLELFEPEMFSFVENGYYVNTDIFFQKLKVALPSMLQGKHLGNMLTF